MCAAKKGTEVQKKRYEMLNSGKWGHSSQEQ